MVDNHSLSSVPKMRLKGIMLGTFRSVAITSSSHMEDGGGSEGRNGVSHRHLKTPNRGCRYQGGVVVPCTYCSRYVCNNRVRQFNHRDRPEGLRPCPSRSSLLCPANSQKRTSSESTGKCSGYLAPHHQTTGRMRGEDRVAFDDFHSRRWCFRRWAGAQQQPELCMHALGE